MVHDDLPLDALWIVMRLDLGIHHSAFEALHVDFVHGPHVQILWQTPTSPEYRDSMTRCLMRVVGEDVPVGAVQDSLLDLNIRSPKLAQMTTDLRDPDLIPARSQGLENPWSKRLEDIRYDDLGP
jgi:hypothetical protein